MALTWVKIANLKGPKGDAGDTAAMNRFDAIEAKNVTQDTRLDGVESKNTAQDTRLTTAETKNTAQDGRLDAVESKNGTQDGRLSTIEAKNTAQDLLITQNTVWMGKIGTGGDLNTATGVKQRVSLYEIGDYGVGVSNMPPGAYAGSVEAISNFDGRRVVQRVTYNTTDPKLAGTWERQGVDLLNNGVFTWTAWLRRTPAGAENKTVLSRMTGWTAGPTTNATFNLNDTSETMLGSNSVTMTTDGTGAATLSYVSVDVPKFNLTGRGLVLWLKVTNIDSINNLAIKVATSSAFTAAYATTLPVANGSGKSPLKNGELFPVYLSAANFFVNNGSPSMDNLTSIRISMGDKAGPPAPSVTIAGIATYEDKTRKYPRGVISICFDDTLVSHATIVAPKLANYGFPATEYTVYDTVGSGAGYLSLAQLRKLQEANGWEIAAHASNVAAHVDWSTQTYAWVESELAAQKAWQDANDFPTKTFAYPIGPFTSTIARQVSKRYDSARSTFGWTNSAAEPHDYRLSCYVVNAAYDPAWAQTIIDRMVERQSGWTIFMFHGLVESGATGNDTNRAAFNTIIEAIAASGIPVATVGDVIAASKV